MIDTFFFSNYTLASQTFGNAVAGQFSKQDRIIVSTQRMLFDMAPKWEIVLYYLSLFIALRERELI